MSFDERLIALMRQIHPLDRIARAGYVLRGVTEPESIAAHSHFVALMTMLLCDEHPDLFDKQKAISIALIHDLAESQLMDIPVPAGDAHLGEAKDEAEVAITDELFADFPSRYRELFEEWVAGESPEARLVKGLDKAQMMIKIVCYQSEGRGRLEEFWASPKNFNDQGLAPLSDLFDAICHAAGRPRPRDH